MTGTRIRLRHGASWTVVTVVYLAIAGFFVVLSVNYATNGQPVLAVVGAGAARSGRSRSRCCSSQVPVGRRRSPWNATGSSSTFPASFGKR
ncbi:MAG: hypothetical protein ACRD12_17855 [Acidimicrobiales bacterium]